MSYAQWVTITIIPKGGVTLTIKNVGLKWGKFHEKGNKDAEIGIDRIENMTIKPKYKGVICSCGRSDSASGTEGSFDIYDGDIHIGNYYWECPWGSKNNISNWRASDAEVYMTEVSGADFYSGALGNITIKCRKDDEDSRELEEV